MGEFSYVRFKMKGLYNRLSKSDIGHNADTDTGKALGYLQQKAEVEENLFGKYTLNKERRLENILWVDS